MIASRIEIAQDRIADFCRRNGVRKLALFGSVLSDRFTDASDIDVLWNSCLANAWDTCECPRWSANSPTSSAAAG